MLVETHKEIYFIGIGGIGLSALARYFLSKDCKVLGSDTALSPLIKDLDREGAIIYIGHNANNLKGLKNPLVIYSQAIKPDNPEMKTAKLSGFKCASYPEAVGELTKKFKTIALAGAHGKSTTTALVALILIEAGLDPTVIVGTKLKEFGGSNFRLGKSDYLVLEADEYGGAFWHYFPFLSGITNIDREHLDFYKNYSNIKKSFIRFLKNHPNNSRIIINDFDSELKGLAKSVKSIKPIFISHTFKSVSAKLKEILKISGKHNSLNASIAYFIARELGISKKIILKALARYQGAWRRMEFKGIFKLPGIKNKTYFFDEYAPHPSEIKATLQGLREKYPRNALICVFQPHQAQRLKLLFNDFKKAFTEANATILLPAYFVAGREKKPSKQYSSESLSRYVKNACYVDNPNKDLNKIIKMVIGRFESPVTLVMMGAGSVIEYSQAVLKSLK